MPALEPAAPVRPGRSGWRPLLADRDAEQALAVVREILQAADPGDNPSLLTGSAGLALLHGYAGQAGLESNGISTASELLDHAIAPLAEGDLDPWLAGGVAGIAWVAAHLEQRGILPRLRGRFTDVDSAVEAFLLDLPPGTHFELCYGLAGLGVYALERFPHPASRRLLALLLDRLQEMAVHCDQGVSWFTGPHMVPDDPQLAKAPAGYYNLGMAHGMPGVVALLGATCRTGVRRHHARRLLGGAVAWLLAQRLGPDVASCFPSTVAPGLSAEPSRLAWCYGDAGVAGALHLAGVGAKQPAWTEEALGIMTKAARLAPEDSGVVDAGLCHGSAGLAIQFHRMYQATGEERMADAARYWIGRTLQFRRSGQGVAGYLARMGTTDAGGERWVAESGLLTGAAGIGLVLLSAATPLEPAWDRALLMSAREG
jgi:hypothetical protein